MAHDGSWGRSPLVVAGIAVACVLGALLALFVAAVSDEQLWGVVVAVLLLLAALVDLAVLAWVLVRDPFPREVLQRLDDIEVRLASDGLAASPAPPRPRPAEPVASAAPQPPPARATEAAPVAPRPEPDLPARPSDPPPPRPPISWELLLGGRGLAIVGGVVLLVAIGLFVKFGWDQGWFRPSPAGRVLLGLAAGFALLTLGEVARRSERFCMLAQALNAVGVGAIYVSTWAAHGLYGLVTAGPALLLLAAAAAAGATIAVATGGRAVASLSAVGGLLAPAVVELPPQPPTVLYVYLLVVLAAAAAVATGRRWPELGPIAAAGAAVHVAAAFEWRWPSEAGRLVDAGFLLTAVVLMVTVSLGFAWRRREAPGPVELAVLGASSLAGWGAGLVRLDPLGDTVGGAWTLTVLLVELVAARVLFARLGEDARGRMVFLAVAGVLAVALPPVVWDGAWVAAAWAAEALTVVVVGRGRTAADRIGAGIALLTVAAALQAGDDALPPDPFANLEGAVRGVAAVLVVALLAVIERRRGEGREVSRELSWVAAPAAVLASLAWLVPEIGAWAGQSVGPRAADGLVVVLVGVLLAGASAALLATWSHRTATATWLTALGAAAAVLLWGGDLWGLGRWHAGAAALPVAAVAATVAAAAWRGRDGDERRPWTAAGLGIGVAVASIVRLGLGWPGADVVAGGLVPAGLGGIAAVLLLRAAGCAVEPVPRRLLSVAGWTTAVAAASRALAASVALAPAVAGADSERAGLVSLSVLWGGAGLALVLVGLARAAPHLRHLGLALLGLTVVKVFLFDLASAPTVLRIVAFLVTGLALLGGSWLYARYRERLEPAP